VNRDIEAGVTWVIDECGDKVPNTLRWSDNYERNLQAYPEGHPDRLPDPNDFELRPLPPIRSARDGASDSSGAVDDGP
jgi:hypothetical protein